MSSTRLMAVMRNPSFYSLDERYPSSEDECYDDEEEEDEEIEYESPRITSSLFAAKTGTDFLLGPHPLHLNSLSAIPEQVIEVNPNLINKMMLWDASRISSTKKPYYKVVYDCFGLGFEHEYFDEEAMSRFLETDIIPISIGTPSYRQHLPKASITPKEDTLIFESRFESGNLRRAVQIFDYEYDLILKFDVETSGHTQWFYFSVKNAKKGKKYKFNIVNYLKPGSLYNQGMMPLIYSVHDANTKGIGWTRGGSDICYYRNNIRRKSGNFYTLTFTVEFDNDDDTYFFAYSYPYTYTNLQNYLNNLEKDKIRSQFVRRRILCQDVAGNACDLLTITSFACDPTALKRRKGVVLTARVHPGESNSSWMIKGVIDFLTGSSIESKVLRENFIFKVVPMLNPDGVINGNYRCCLTGSDLNRRWHAPNEKTHPTIFHTKKMILEFMKEREIALFCDFHGHSRKKNIFMYGCSDSKSGVERLAPKVFPRLLWKISPHFSFNDCQFGKQKGKDTTARVILHKSGIKNCFTLEASFCGPDNGIHNGKHFTCKHFEQMGHYFCQGILEFCNPERTQVALILKELDLLFPEKSEEPIYSKESYSSSEDEDEPIPLPLDKLKKRKTSPPSQTPASRTPSYAPSTSYSSLISFTSSKQPTLILTNNENTNTTNIPHLSHMIASTKPTLPSSNTPRFSQPIPPNTAPPNTEKIRPQRLKRSQSFSKEAPKTTNQPPEKPASKHENPKSKKKTKPPLPQLSTPSTPAIPKSLYKPRAYTPPYVDINPFTYDADKLMESFKDCNHGGLVESTILDLIEKVQSIQNIRKERDKERKRSIRLRPMKSKPLNKLPLPPTLKLEDIINIHSARGNGQASSAASSLPRLSHQAQEIVSQPHGPNKKR
ncbi:hypothetical protein C9374_006421 [Naegleria lovaniensis]|uniref:Peptidase M14 domain-containing protein n=1 Tax=Naegleria lovaniensis TaxID=51637 RepID=A0AA88GN21_NAELO|nr:uncharacterized protein C9374_006421 [Naegleria lovaniensis]KAG2381432.1 hypothetical protein C9374_006421 [Naegleria lovaniensis]